MIKLIGILKEAYVDSLGNLIDQADFIILEGGLKGGIFKNSNKISVNDYVNFTTKLNSFRKTNIANKIYKQVLEIYSKSALKKYNDLINFEPSLDIDKGDGGYEAAGFSINLSKGLGLSGLLEVSHYLPNTGFENMVKRMRDSLGIKDTRSDDEKNLEKDKSISKKFGDLDVKDLNDKIENLPMICIPKFNFEGNLVKTSDVDLDTGNENFNDHHELYNKSNLLHDLNEVGMFLLSKKEKSPIVDLDKLGYKLYTIDYISEYIGYRDDDSSYTIELGGIQIFKGHTSKNTMTLYVMTNKDEDIKQAIKRLSGNRQFNLYDTLFSSKYLASSEKKHEIKQIKQDIKEIPHAKLDINFFNYLKKNIYGDNNVKDSKIYDNVRWEHENNSVLNIKGVLTVKSLL